MEEEDDDLPALEALQRFHIWNINPEADARLRAEDARRLAEKRAEKRAQYEALIYEEVRNCLGGPPEPGPPEPSAAEPEPAAAEPEPAAEPELVVAPELGLAQLGPDEPDPTAAPPARVRLLAAPPREMSSFELDPDGLHSMLARLQLRHSFPVPASLSPRPRSLANPPLARYAEQNAVARAAAAARCQAEPQLLAPQAGSEVALMETEVNALAEQHAREQMPPPKRRRTRGERGDEVMRDARSDWDKWGDIRERQTHFCLALLTTDNEMDTCVGGTRFGQGMLTRPECLQACGLASKAVEEVMMLEADAREGLIPTLGSAPLWALTLAVETLQRSRKDLAATNEAAEGCLTWDGLVQIYEKMCLADSDRFPTKWLTPPSRRKALQKLPNFRAPAHLAFEDNELMSVPKNCIGSLRPARAKIDKLNWLLRQNRSGMLPDEKGLCSVTAGMLGVARCDGCLADVAPDLARQLEGPVRAAQRRTEERWPRHRKPGSGGMF